jgi:hypothetical protein
MSFPLFYAPPDQRLNIGQLNAKDGGVIGSCRSNLRCNQLPSHGSTKPRHAT